MRLKTTLRSKTAAATNAASLEEETNCAAAGFCQGKEGYIQFGLGWFLVNYIYIYNDGFVNWDFFRNLNIRY